MNRGLHCLLVLSSISLADCKDVSTGPYRSVLALERWHRADPATDFTGTGLVTFHADDRVPRWVDLDENCGAQIGNWGDSEFRPPRFGNVEMNVAGAEAYRFNDDAEGAGFDSTTEMLWDTGDELQVTADGSEEAPAFAVDAIVPALVQLTSHNLNALSENELHLPRDVPLDLTWAPTDGDVVALLMQFHTDDAARKDVGIWCVYPGSSGGATMPVAVLENLLPSSEELSTNLYVGGGSRETLALAGVDLQIITFKGEAARIQVD